MDEEEFVKELVLKNNNKMRLRDVLLEFQKFRKCSREPAYRRLQELVGYYDGLHWVRESPRKLFVVFGKIADDKP